MTFQEYLSQKDPKKFHPGSVEVKKQELYFGYRFGRIGYSVGLIIHGEMYTYIIPVGDDCMWTMDDDGNKRVRSVFKLIL